MRKILTTTMMVILILSMFSTVYAATGKINVGASVDTIEIGKSFIVTISATADAPIDGMYTKISYDNNILKLEETKVGENYSNNSGSGEIFVTNNSAEESPKTATLCTLKFTVLDTTKESVNIVFSESELHLNNKAAAVKVEDIEVNIKKAEQKPEQVPEQKPEPEKKPSNKLPQTGIEIVSVIVMAALAVVSVIFYKSYRRYRDI